MDKLFINLKDNILVRQHVVNFSLQVSNVQLQELISKYNNDIKLFRKCIIWDVGSG